MSKVDSFTCATSSSSMKLTMSRWAWALAMENGIRVRKESSGKNHSWRRSHSGQTTKYWFTICGIENKIYILNRIETGNKFITGKYYVEPETEISFISAVEHFLVMATGMTRICWARRRFESWAMSRWVYLTRPESVVSFEPSPLVTNTMYLSFESVCGPLARASKASIAPYSGCTGKY